MTNWLCVKCLHEFSGDGVRKKPEYAGMAIFFLFGAALFLFVLACIYTGLIRSLYYAIYSALALLFGLGMIEMGLRFRKGVKAFCPACGRPQGVAADSQIATMVRRGKARKT